jgi:hypothetical protein
MTFNSTNEIDLYKKKMDPHHFNPVVELTELGGGENWLEAACQSGVKCDQLIISGHFAGSFFGEGEGKDKFLSLEEMESASCKKSCAGIFKNPSEVFLFGCNTLAGSGLKTRTPDEYLSVLRDHHFDEYYAQQIVASSYGIEGQSNKTRMQNVFSGDKKIYGFNSIAPAGKTVEPFWNNYLNKEKPHEHLDKVFTKKAVGLVDYTNIELSKSLSQTAFEQCNGTNENNQEKKLICSLLDPKSTPKQKLLSIQELMMSDNFLSYIPLINGVIEEGAENGTFDLSKLSLEDKQILKQLSDNKVIKDMILSASDKMKLDAPALEGYSFLRSMGMMSDGLYNQKVLAKLNHALDGKDISKSGSTFCEPKLVRHFHSAKTFQNLDSTKVGGLLKSREGAIALGCMGISTRADIQPKLTNLLKKYKGVEDRTAVIKAFTSGIKPENDPNIVNLMVNLAKTDLPMKEMGKSIDDSSIQMMYFFSKVKRVPDLDQMMVENLKSSETNPEIKAWTLKYFYNNRPVSGEEKKLIEATIRSSNHENVKAYSGLFR